MSDRASDRVKVVIEWELSTDDDNWGLIHEDLRDQVRGSISILKNAYLGRRINVYETRRQVHERLWVYRTEVRIYTKRSGPNVRQVDWPDILMFCARIRSISAIGRAKSQFIKVATYDVSPSRMPWVFHDARQHVHPTQLLVRPGYKTYHVKLGREVEFVRDDIKLMALLNLDTSDLKGKVATELMIVGEPVAARKLFGYYNQLTRGGKLNQDAQLSRTQRTNYGDLALVLCRNDQADGKWQLLNDDGHYMHRGDLSKALQGPLQYGENQFDLGTRYELFPVAVTGDDS